VAFGKLKRKLGATVEQLDAARLQERYAGLDVSSIAEAPLRCPMRICGEVQETRVVPRAGAPSFVVTIADGSGRRAYGVFTGTTKIPGMGLGRGVLFEGVAGLDGNNLTLLNPAYTLL
jgi:hypothetical protein